MFLRNVGEFLPDYMASHFTVAAGGRDKSEELTNRCSLSLEFLTEQRMSPHCS
jgi:hypothetical protein